MGMKAVVQTVLAGTVLGWFAHSVSATTPPQFVDLIGQPRHFVEESIFRGGYNRAAIDYNDFYYYRRNANSCIVATVIDGKVPRILEIAERHCLGDSSADTLGAPGSQDSAEGMAATCRERVQQMFRTRPREVVATYLGRHQNDRTHQVDINARIAGEERGIVCNFSRHGSLKEVVVKLPL